MITVMIQRISRSFFVELEFVEASETNMPPSGALFRQTERPGDRMARCGALGSLQPPGIRRHAISAQTERSHVLAKVAKHPARSLFVIPVCTSDGNGVGSRFRAAINYKESGLPENDSRPLSPVHG
jgi:hypothetical protein